MGCQGVSQPVGIKSAISQQVICREVFDQVRHAAQVVGLTRQQTEIDEIARRVRQRQYLGRDAAP